MPLIHHILTGFRHMVRQWLNWSRVAAITPKTAFISPRARFVGKNIYIGAGTRVEDNVFMRCGVHSRDSTERIQIGERCRIWHGVELHSWGGNIRIGNRSSLNPYCILYGHGGLEIGSHVRIATHVVIVAANHKFDRNGMSITEQGVTAKGIVIENDVWIGAGAIILDGVRIGGGAVIAAGAVISRDVLPNAVVAGVPGRALRFRGGKQLCEQDQA
jgi:acetyltransferase-like isoleucine patch superfamily enzyme